MLRVREEVAAAVWRSALHEHQVEEEEEEEGGARYQTLCRLRMLQSPMSRNENPWDHLSPVSQNQREEEDVGGCPKKGRFCCF
ncbi:unnamed protein product [Pleuronectes platessa]|uniref:Uncharacterized protein n=1 Tax=Pleuronectes platessa TaxID=8262 RepID=A0A9N7V1L3_PLEPL|nr:unnamed protein product [Pleuronectes platessa]